ncbi:MAG: hypothetical protein M1305_06140, partial [Candidatus Marsarchaeota archaeon]|nr:hypothetical protein [Candidatus Marsarchaeota archaeon]
MTNKTHINGFIVVLVALVGLSACAPSQGAIQTAIAQTQEAMPTAILAPSAISIPATVTPRPTLTLYPTHTSEPTSTSGPTDTNTPPPTETPDFVETPRGFEGGLSQIAAPGVRRVRVPGQQRL